MSDPVSLARAARENLARGLAALQSPSVPPQVMAVAEPIAAAMSALHRVEASHGQARGEAGPAALASARQALALLQQHPPGFPPIDQALEAIAGSLSLIHQLAQPAAAPAAHAPAAFAGTVALGQGTAPPPTQPSAQPAWGPPPQAGYQQPPAYQQQPPQQPPAYQQPAAYQQPPAYQQAPAAAPAYQAPAAAPAYQAPAAAPPYQAPVAAPAYQAPAAAPAPAAGGAGAPLRIEAELGAHSSTNFYKGLSGNDVIDSGGIFVATYQIPPIGRSVVVKVSMPGGYEFEALGVVRWTREAPLSGSDSPPGFGAQFTQISPEGRQLVYRYVRNREPLFHDDL
jgi:PilZ domain